MQCAARINPWEKIPPYDKLQAIICKKPGVVDDLGIAKRGKNVRILFCYSGCDDARRFRESEAKSEY
jgi:hypothetical protein